MWHIAGKHLFKTMILIKIVLSFSDFFWRKYRVHQKPNPTILISKICQNYAKMRSMCSINLIAVYFNCENFGLFHTCMTKDRSVSNNIKFSTGKEDLAEYSCKDQWKFCKKHHEMQKLATIVSGQNKVLLSLIQRK